MKECYTLILLLAFSLSTKAQVNVTFQVDMNQQTVSADGVHCAGKVADSSRICDDWDASTAELLDPDMDGVYELTVQLAAGTCEYKFINGNAWGSDEGSFQLCYKWQPRSDGGLYGHHYTQCLFYNLFALSWWTDSHLQHCI